MTATNRNKRAFNSKFLTTALIAICFFVAFSAIPAGLAFVIKPDGSLLQMDAGIYKIPLFKDFLLPGFVLTSVIGAGQLLTALLLMRKSQKRLWVSLISGVILIIWIVVQVLLIGFNSWLQPFIFALGLTEILITLTLLKQQNLTK
jgi:hypothetical protein